MGVEGTNDDPRPQKFRTTCRTNGWMLPPHPLQFVAWISLFIFAFAYFSTLVPGLPSEWQPAGYIINGLIFAIHTVVHIVSCSINPADPSVLRKANLKTIPDFDRSLHKHVIENMHCYLCEVDVGSKSKHCSSCNKCVSVFDHHCKWLNNCVGNRNYRWFLSVLLSGIVGALMIGTVGLVEFITYFTDRDTGHILQPYIEALNSGTNVTENEIGDLAVFRILNQPVPGEGWVSFVAITTILSLVGAALIFHLFSFHCYLIYKGMTTYDYIVKQRHKEAERQVEAEIDTSRSYKNQRKKMNKITPSEGMEMKESPNRKISSRVSCDPMEYQTVLEEAEGQIDGETPPPSTSPIHLENNNLYKQKLSNESEQNTSIKKLKRKKKSQRRDMPATIIENQEMKVSTIGDPRLYTTPHHEEILPPPPDIIQAVGLPADYHSDSADSLQEIPTTVTPRARKPLLIDDSKVSVDFSPDLADNSKRKKKKKKKNAQINDKSEITENIETFGNVNPTVSFDAVLSKRRPFDVPPLDFSGIKSSNESLSFKPYSALRSSETFRTDRVMHPWPERTVVDTEV